MYQVYRQTMGNKPLLFGGGSPDTVVSEDLTGVEFINGSRRGNPRLVELAKSQVGNVGGQPYWSWYGFDSRVKGVQKHAAATVPTVQAERLVVQCTSSVSYTHLDVYKRQGLALMNGHMPFIRARPLS